jgi:hypothetical protein
MSRGQNTHCALSLSLKSTGTCYAFRVSSAPCAETYSPPSASLYRERIIYSDSEQSDSPKKVLATDHFWREADIRQNPNVS